MSVKKSLQTNVFEKCAVCNKIQLYKGHKHIPHAHDSLTRERCLNTPAWMMFAFCYAPLDGAAAALWHDVRGPFPVPINLPPDAHKCQWELFDDYMAGCVHCGKVHRCDFDICEEVLSCDTRYRQYVSECRSFLRCPTVQIEHEGSIVCTITGSCVRTKVFGVEYDMVANKGFTMEKMNSIMKSDSFMYMPMQCHTNASAKPSASRNPKMQHYTDASMGGYRNKYGNREGDHGDCCYSGYDNDGYSGGCNDGYSGYNDDGDKEGSNEGNMDVKFHGNGSKNNSVNEGSMYNEDWNEGWKILNGKVRRGGRTSCGSNNNTNKGEHSHGGICKKSFKRRHSKQQTNSSSSTSMRGAFVVRLDSLQGEFSAECISRHIWQFLHIAGQNQSLLYIRFLEACESREAFMKKYIQDHAIKHGTARPICLCTMAAAIAHSCQIDPFQCLSVYSDTKLNALAKRITPSIIRLVAVLKTLNTSKYRVNNIPSMILGMIYLCTTGIQCSHVRILPSVPELLKIMPNDNRIHHYFGSMGVNTKCVTEVSNIVNLSLKDRMDVLKVFESG
jgi:hypothetical protein